MKPLMGISCNTASCWVVGTDHTKPYLLPAALYLMPLFMLHFNTIEQPKKQSQGCNNSNGNRKPERYYC